MICSSISSYLEVTVSRSRKIILRNLPEEKSIAFLLKKGGTEYSRATKLVALQIIPKADTS